MFLFSQKSCSQPLLDTHRLSRCCFRAGRKSSCCQKFASIERIHDELGCTLQIEGRIRICPAFPDSLQQNKKSHAQLSICLFLQVLGVSHLHALFMDLPMLCTQRFKRE